MAAELNPDEKILKYAPGSGSLAQAYLIHASSCSGAEAQAFSFAKRILCRKHTGCGICDTCRKFENGNHVDAFVLKTDLKILKKADVESIPEFIADRAYEGGYKVVLIIDADKMNTVSQNLLLKSLEEPPANVVFIFSTANPSGMLSTIRSRCIEILIHPHPLSEIRSALESKGIAGDFARACAVRSGGSLEEAERLCADEGFIKSRAAAAELFEGLLAERNPVVFRLTALLSGDFTEILVSSVYILSDAIKLSFGFDASLLSDPEHENTVGRLCEALTPAGMSFMTDVLLDAIEKKRACPSLNSRLQANEIIIKLLEVKSRCLR